MLLLSITHLGQKNKILLIALSSIKGLMINIAGEATILDIPHRKTLTLLSHFGIHTAVSVRYQKNALFQSRGYCKTQTPEAETFTHDPETATCCECVCMCVCLCLCVFPLIPTAQL